MGDALRRLQKEQLQLQMQMKEQQLSQLRTRFEMQQASTLAAPPAMACAAPLSVPSSVLTTVKEIAHCHEEKVRVQRERLTEKMAKRRELLLRQWSQESNADTAGSPRREGIPMSLSDQ